MVSADLIVEDELSEEVVRRLFAESAQEFHVRTVYGRGGFGYIKKNIRRYNQAAKYVPYIVMTDLDAHWCAPELIRAWLPDPKSPQLLFRVAVREPEAWLLADGKSFAALLGIRTGKIPANPEGIPDPKQILLALATTSRNREIREGLVTVMDDGRLNQGPDYNGILSRHVRKDWNPDIAQEQCLSLRKMRQRLDTFTLAPQP